ncbi:MAG: hypothetical protein HYT11_03615 [Candidatus Levybacteria bacterium]|nr:hypothetical protein [Candidatus Levybacteria bacterium]
MDPIQQTTTTLQPAPPPSTKPSKKLAIILFAIVAVLLLFSVFGSYYYLEIYQPNQYAKKVIPIYDEITSNQMGIGNNQGSNTYEDVLIFLDQYQAFLTQAKVKVATLKPSPLKTAPSFLANTKRSQQIQEDFTRILEFFIDNISAAKTQVQFMVKAKELFLLLRPDLTAYPPKAELAGQGTPLPPPPSTAGEFLTVWEPRISKAKIIAQELFDEPQDVQGIDLEELKSLWQETEEGLDVLLPFLRKQDSKLSMSEVQKLIPEGEKALFAKVDKIDEFRPKLENVLIRNSGENILRYQFEFNNSKKGEFETSFARLNTNIKQLKEKYGK